MKSLRYRDVDVDSVPGLKCLILNRNQLLDRVLEIIASRLKEDMCMKAIEVQNCDISDVDGEAILNCLKFNKTLVVFDASHNYKISRKILKKIQMILNTESDNYETMPKVTNYDLREKIEFLEQRLQLETFNRERADDLNVELHRNLVKSDQEVFEKLYQPPTGFKMIESGELNALYKEIEYLAREKETSRKSNAKETVGDGKDIGEQSDSGHCGVGKQSGFEEQFGFREQSGFGDTLTCSNKQTTFDTSVPFTPYSQESSCDLSSKFDDDAMTVNLEDVYGTDKGISVFEEHIGYD